MRYNNGWNRMPIGCFRKRDVATAIPASRDMVDDTDYFSISTDMGLEGVSHITAGQHLAHRYEGLAFSNCPSHEHW